VIDWQPAGHDYTDILHETAEGIAKITINRPEVRNAFRPATLFELRAHSPPPGMTPGSA